MSILGVVAAGVLFVVGIAVLPRNDHGPGAPVAGPHDPTVALASSLAVEMARPWPPQQERNGHIRPGIGGGTRYGDAMIGYALLQDGLRRNDLPLAHAGLRAIGLAVSKAAIHALRGGSHSVFEGLALAGAYNLARTRLARDSEFLRIRGEWQRVLGGITMIRLPATGYYGNHWLVEAVEVRELLRTGVRSTGPYAVLGGWRSLAGRLSTQLINRRIPAMARQQSVRIAHRRAFVLSDPPDNPLAYQGLSFGLYARAIHLLGHRASRAARRTLLEVANASLWLTAPDGDVGYFGRNQEEAWGLAGTAYGAAAAARLPGVGSRRAAALRTLARRTLLRLRDVHRVGRQGLNITPGVAASPVEGSRGADPAAGGAPFAGLALALVDWSVPELAAGDPKLGRLPLDRSGGAVLARGPSQFAVVRRGRLWYAVRGTPSYKHPYELRDDFGLVSVKLLRRGRWTQPMPLRPITNGAPDSAGPALQPGSTQAFPFGDRVTVSRRGVVTVYGGYRRPASTFRRFVAHLANDAWVRALGFTPGALVRSGTRFRFQPLACGGIRLAFTTQPGDLYEYSEFFRSPPRAAGSAIADESSRVTSSAPGRTSIQNGYASGLDPRLWRARIRFSSPTGNPASFSLCATSPSSASPSASPPQP